MGTLSGSMASNTFRGQFDFDYTEILVYGDEPSARGNQSSWLLSATDSDLRLGNTLEIEFYYYYYDTQVWGLPIGIFEIQNNSQNWLKFQIGSNSTNLSVSARTNNVYDSKTQNGYFNTVPGWYKIKFTWSGTAVELFKDDVSVWTDTWANLANMVQIGATLRLYNTIAGDVPIPAGHRLRDFSYTTAGSLIGRWIVCEDSGNTVYNVVANDLHLTGQAVWSGITWNRDVTSNKYLKDYGYRLASGVYIPSLLDGSAAADGNALTNIPLDTEFN